MPKFRAWPQKLDSRRGETAFTGLSVRHNAEFLLTGLGLHKTEPLALSNRLLKLKKTAISVDSDGKRVFFECRLVLIFPRHVQKDSCENTLRSPAWQ